MNSTGGDVPRGRSLRTRSRSPEKPRERVHHDGQLGDTRSGGGSQVDHPGDQFGGRLSATVPTQVLEHLGGGVAAGSRQAGHQDDVDVGGAVIADGITTTPALSVIGISVIRLAVHHRPPLRRLHRNRKDRLARRELRNRRRRGSPMPGRR